VLGKVDSYGLNIDIMMEAKAKELAVLEYRNIHKELILS
jgi:hypothetical protein